MNDNKVANLPSEAASRKNELVPEKARTDSPESREDLVGLYQHTPAIFGITLREVFEVLRRRILYLLIGLVVGVELAMLGLVLITPLYAVSAQVVITRQDPGELIDADSGSSAFIATQAEILHSPTVVQAAVEKLPRPSYLGPEGDPVAAALESVHASPISGTRVVALAYLGADPQYGASLLKTIVDIYLSEVRNSTRSGQAVLLESKEAELEELQVMIAQQEAKIEALRQANAIIGTGDEAAAVQNARVDNNVRAVTEARNRRIELESRLASGGDIPVADDPLRISLREDLRLAESELAKARSMLTWEHPSVVAAERNVQALRAQLAALGGSRGILPQQIDELTRLEAELSGIAERSRERLEEIERHRREENKLLQELERMNAQADLWRRELLDQRLVARLARMGDVGIGARIIENPIIPDEPVWPKKKFMLAAGAAFGLGLGFVFGLISLRRRRKREMKKM